MSHEILLQQQQKQQQKLRSKNETDKIINVRMFKEMAVMKIKFPDVGLSLFSFASTFI